MGDRFFRWLTLSLIVAASAASTAHAQGPGGDSDSHTPALPYAVACLSTIIVMVILCMPSRKG